MAAPAIVCSGQSHIAEAAPFHADVAWAPEGMAAHWRHAADGLKLRIAHAVPARPAGTVLLFPGRTEYVEKYGEAAQRFADAGLATLAIDWRGQGLSDRMLDDRLGGHVMEFADYQMDVAAMIEAAEALDLPRPFHLLAHSMGGCIGLRALINGLPVNSAVFSSPMWGISISAGLRPVAWTMSWIAGRVGLGHRYAPGTSGGPYPEAVPFEDNLLTNDLDQWRRMGLQTERYPDLALAGPSIRWLGEALTECRALAQMASPEVPMLTILGDQEKIVDPDRIHERVAMWPDAELHVVSGGRHETMMDTAEMREQVYGRIIGHFSAHV